VWYVVIDFNLIFNSIAALNFFRVRAKDPKSGVGQAAFAESQRWASKATGRFAYQANGFISHEQKGDSWHWTSE